jgi:hypothetical protein
MAMESAPPETAASNREEETQSPISAARAADTEDSKNGEKGRFFCGVGLFLFRFGLCGRGRGGRGS